MSDETKEPCPDKLEPDADPGAWPENPPPGTPAALHNQLTKQHEDGGAQHPTHIPTEHEQRDRNRSDKK